MLSAPPHDREVTPMSGETSKTVVTVTIEVSPGGWKDTYGEYPTADDVRSYVHQALSESGAAEEGAFVKVAVR